MTVFRILLSIALFIAAILALIGVVFNPCFVLFATSDLGRDHHGGGTQLGGCEDF